LIKRRICFDANIFIALMNPKSYDVSVITSIHTLLGLVDNGEVYAVCSSLIPTELLDGSLELMEARCDGRKGELVDVDPQIASMARRIRNKIVRKTKSGNHKCLETPDCIYLATAVYYDCAAMVTLDGFGDHERHSMLNSADEIFKEFKLRVISPLDAVDQRAFHFAPEDEPETSVQ
jgi:predicted nucleic acid-binding protein